MKLSVPQKTVAQDPARFKTVIAGRRFGKTTLAIREICYHARLPNQICWAVLPSYRQAKMVWWDQLKTKLKSLNWVKKINEAELSIVLKNNSKISLKGADGAGFENLRGAKLNFLVLDEAANIPSQAWTEVLRPALADSEGKALFIGTPKGVGNFLYDLYQTGEDTTQDQWKSFSFTTAQGGFVSELEIEQAKRDLDKKTFQQEFEATFVTYSGMVYYGFKRSENVAEFTFTKPQKIIHVAIDMNIDPMSAVCFVITDGKVVVIDEIEMFGSNTDELVNEIYSRFPGTKIFAYPDPASRQRKTSAGGRTDLSILANAGFIVKAPNKHMPVRDRINSVNSMLCNGKGERQILIHPKCKKLISCLERQIYKPGTSQPDKDNGWDHMNDALGYGISYLFPITRQYTHNQTQTNWTVRI